LRVLIQRVARAKVRKTPSSKDKNKDSEVGCNSIGRGLLLFVGIGKDDNEETAKYLANKIYQLRLFENNGKFDFSLADIKGEALIVPQFTLYGNTDKGRRPEFTLAASPNRARELFDYFFDCLNGLVTCRKGFFGERMEVELVNDGPVTLLIER